MGNMTVKRSGGQGLAVNSGPTVLGERQARIPVGGRVRAGIKVLTSAAKNSNEGAKAQRIYERGVESGASWDEIEKVLRDKCGFRKSPLTPRNVPYFTVKRSDFQIPETADRIMELYAEPDEDGVPRLFRFPVIFPTDNWQANLPHALKAYTRSELLYWSEYDADGVRHCYTRQAAEMDQKSRRAKRPWGGRPVIPRPDNGGICDPENCPQYQNRECTLHGEMLFFIPGVPGTSAIALPTTSFYAMDQCRQKMELVSYLRGGRISGTHHGRAIFYLTKTQQQISMVDPETGRGKRVKQYLATLEADVDMLSVFRDAERQQLEDAGAAGRDAAAHLEYHEPEDWDGEPGPIPQDPPRPPRPDDTPTTPPRPRADPEPEPDMDLPDEAPPADEAPPVPEPDAQGEPVTGELVDEEPPADAGADPEGEPAADASEPEAKPETQVDPGGLDPSTQEQQEKRAYVFDTLQQLDIVAEVFDRYMMNQWGEGWAGEDEGLDKAIQVLEHGGGQDDVAAWKASEGLDVPF